MLGCCSDLRRSISIYENQKERLTERYFQFIFSFTIREDSCNFFFLVALSLTLLMATQFPILLCTARQTTPKAPRPITSIKIWVVKRKELLSLHIVEERCVARYTKYTYVIANGFFVLHGAFSSLLLLLLLLPLFLHDRVATTGGEGERLSLLPLPFFFMSQRQSDIVMLTPVSPWVSSIVYKIGWPIR